ncbi:PREDICTED: uncharacterized protein LOC109356428 [Lupinus angustifolius]|uniref:uncharacterized protein LOC109356428 n=1 Tax=Lupinus angustifolius TaxID=3871 RepID=UPI00092EE6B1|nr:PREDICTED: uncharacterized protein LOC109356428 [Lupinus angustifolius]
MCTGWMSFVQENKVKVGDVCLFQMIDPRKFSFKVNIFQAREEEPSLDMFQANLLNQNVKPKTEWFIQNVDRGFLKAQFGEGSSWSTPKVDFIASTKQIWKQN